MGCTGKRVSSQIDRLSTGIENPCTICGVYCVYMPTSIKPTQIMTTDEPAEEAVKLQNDILARLDELTASEEQPDVETSGGSELKPEKLPEPQAPTMEEQLDALETLLDGALASGNEDEVRRLCQQGRDILRAEKISGEESLQEAKDYFDIMIKEQGESGEGTALALKEVADWKAWQRAFDKYIAQKDVYYDTVISQMHDSPAIEATSVVENTDVPVVMSVEQLQAQRELIDRQRVRIEELRALIAEIEKKEKLDGIKKAHGISIQ